MCVHVFFFFNDTATTEIYTLSLHDALPICRSLQCVHLPACRRGSTDRLPVPPPQCHKPRAPRRWRQSGRSPCAADRKSTRLNSSHANISYAVFCLKKKKIPKTTFST